MPALCVLLRFGLPAARVLERHGSRICSRDREDREHSCRIIDVPGLRGVTTVPETMHRTRQNHAQCEAAFGFNIEHLRTERSGHCSSKEDCRKLAHLMCDRPLREHSVDGPQWADTCGYLVNRQSPLRGFLSGGDVSHCVQSFTTEEERLAVLDSKMRSAGISSVCKAFLSAEAIEAAKPQLRIQKQYELQFGAVMAAITHNARAERIWRSRRPLRV